jgi:hypothetical protein
VIPDSKEACPDEVEVFMFRSMCARDVIRISPARTPLRLTTFKSTIVSVTHVASIASSLWKRKRDMVRIGVRPAYWYIAEGLLHSKCLRMLYADFGSPTAFQECGAERDVRRAFRVSSAV